MKIFNIDEALRKPTKYKVLNEINEAMDMLYASRQELFEKDNPLRQIYNKVSLDRFQRSYNSGIGFKQAFEQTTDFSIYPGFTDAEGFKGTISYRIFGGTQIITWQALMESDKAAIAERIKNWQTAWQRQYVISGMFALTGMFGKKVFDKTSKSYYYINSIDSVDGDVYNTQKNPIFSKKHTIVKTDEMTDADIEANYQSNKFWIEVDLSGEDPFAVQKLANGLQQVKTYQKKLKDDNNQLAGVTGAKKIVCTEDAQLNSVLNAILAADNFSDATGKTILNPMKAGFSLYTTAYLDGDGQHDMPQFAVDEAAGYAHGLLMLDPAFNAANKGPMEVERTPFKVDVVEQKNPEGVLYIGKQCCDFTCLTWQGIAYIFVGTEAQMTAQKSKLESEKKDASWLAKDTFTKITPKFFKPTVAIDGIVKTKEQQQ